MKNKIIKRFIKWGNKGSWAVAEQGAFSGANFAFNLLLARWLSAESYGAFAIAFMILLLFSSLQNAFIIEPMSVLGPANYALNLEEFSQKTTLLNILIVIILCLILLGLAFSLNYVDGINNKILPTALQGAGLALPFFLSIWLIRRQCYLFSVPQRAFLSSLLYGIILLLGIKALHSYSLLTVFTAFFWLGTAAFSGSIIYLVKSPHPQQPQLITLRQISIENWNYGKWVAVAGILGFIGGQVQLFIVAGYIGLEEAGALRAMYNFFLPMAQMIFAISSLAIFSFANDYAHKDYYSMHKKGHLVTISLLTASIIFEIVIFLTAESLQNVVYGTKYTNYYYLAYLLGLVPIFTSLASGPMLILRALQIPKLYASIGLITALTGIVSSFIFTISWGVAGSAVSMVFTSFVTYLVTILSYRKIMIPLLKTEFIRA